MNDLLLHPKTKSRLKSIIADPPHALLIVGPAGAGKSHLAKYITEQLLSTKNLETHPSVKFIDAHEGDGIEHIRLIRSFLSLKTAGTDKIRRVVVLENVNQLGFDAQNALLKTVEEPPEDSLIIMTGSSTGSVADTVLSRASQLKILPLAKSISSRYSQLATADVNKAYALSGGYAGSFKSILESDGQHEINKSVDKAKLFLTQSIYDRLCTVESLYKDKEAVRLLGEGLLRCLHAAISSSNHKSTKSLVSKLEYVDDFLVMLDENTNAKLLLTALAINL